MTALPALDEIEGIADAWRPQGSARFWRDNRLPATNSWNLPLSCGGCWCGLPNGHPWPGKAEGAPHPRTSAADHAHGQESALWGLPPTDPLGRRLRSPQPSWGQPLTRRRHTERRRRGLDNQKPVRRNVTCEEKG